MFVIVRLTLATFFFDFIKQHQTSIEETVLQ